jgi:hypothetical protein
MRNIPSRIRSDRVVEMCRVLDMSDPFQTLNPDAREFTYNPSGTLRKNRSRIDFFLVTDDVYRFVEKCTIAQGYCRKTFDHKPIFLSLKKKRGSGRVSVTGRTIEHKYATDIVKTAVYLTLFSVCIPVSGIVSRQLLEAKYDKVTGIIDTVNNIILLEGKSQTRDLVETEREQLTTLETELGLRWRGIASLDYLYTFERQVRDDTFFEILIENTRKSLLDLQAHIRA